MTTLATQIRQIKENMKAIPVSLISRRSSHFAPLARPATNDLSAALQKGSSKKKPITTWMPIQAYQLIISQYDQDRKLAATAIFRLGESYRKQGKTNEASVQYDRVIREFADQPALLSLSRQELGCSWRQAQHGYSVGSNGCCRVAESDRAMLDNQIEVLKKLPLEKLRIAVQQQFANPS